MKNARNKRFISFQFWASRSVPPETRIVPSFLSPRRGRPAHNHLGASSGSGPLLRCHSACAQETLILLHATFKELSLQYIVIIVLLYYELLLLISY